MADYDLFNGDADGICALLQLRFAEPREDATLVTGVKRDIKLLQRVEPEAGDRITVLDISLDKNRDDLVRVLDAGAEVFYVDHHFPGKVPESSSLKSMINEAPNVCTACWSITTCAAPIVNGPCGYLWNNLKDSAEGLAKILKLSRQLTLLENLGVYINYNGYGSDLDELHFKPDELYRLLSHYKNPFDFVSDNAEQFNRLESGYHQDLEAAQSLSLSGLQSPPLSLCCRMPAGPGVSVGSTAMT